MGCALSGGSVRAVACEGGEVGGHGPCDPAGARRPAGDGEATVWWRRLTLPGGGGGGGDHVDGLLGPGRGDRRGMGRQAVSWLRPYRAGGGGGVGDHVDGLLWPGSVTGGGCR